MGLSSKKNKTEIKPIYSREIEGAANISADTYAAQQPKASAIADQFGGLVPSLLQKYQDGNPAVNAAEGYATDVLGGKYLSGNPYLEQMIDQTGANTTSRVEGSIGSRGLTGGSGHAAILGRALAENEGRMRYSDYDAERARMGQAASMAPSLAAADAVSIMPALAAGDAAVNLPWTGANNNARNVGGLLGQYTNSTSKQSGGFLGDLLLAGVSSAGAFAGGG